jgi:acetyl esterase/lipase
VSFPLAVINFLLPLTGRKRRWSSEAALLKRLTDRTEHTAASVPRSLLNVADVSERTVRGRRVITVTPKASASVRDIVYLHGGAYVNPLVSAHWAIVRELVTRADARVTVPLYGLAPEHTVDDAFSLLDEVYRRVIEEADGAEVLLAGDSAGGGLALAYCLSLRDAADLHRPMPRRLLLIAPWLDVTLSNPEVARIASRDPMLAVPGPRAAGKLWAGGRGLETPSVSPIFARLRGLPPMLVVQGGRDLTAADVRVLHDRVSAGGGEIELVYSADAFHVFVGLPFLPEARQAWARIEDWVSGPAAAPGSKSLPSG